MTLRWIPWAVEVQTLPFIGSGWLESLECVWETPVIKLYAILGSLAASRNKRQSWWLVLTNAYICLSFAFFIQCFAGAVHKILVISVSWEPQFFNCLSVRFNVPVKVAFSWKFFIFWAKWIFNNKSPITWCVIWFI